MRSTRSAPNVITTERGLKEMVDAYLSMDAFAIDIETFHGEDGEGLDPRRNRVFWLSFATYGRVDVVPCGHPHGRMLDPGGRRKLLPPDEKRRVLKNGTLSNAKALTTVPPVFGPPPPQLSPGEVFTIIEPLLMSPEHIKVNQHLKFDLESIAKYYGNTIVPGPYADTWVLSYLLNENNLQYGLGTLSEWYLDFSYNDNKLGKTGVENASFATAALYAARDAGAAWLLWRKLLPRIDKQGLSAAWRLDMDLLGVLMRSEVAGALIDRSAMQALGEHLEQAIRETYAQLVVDFNHNNDFNPAAKRDLVKLLLSPKSEGGRGLKAKTFTKKTNEPQINKAFYAAYADDPCVQLIQQHAKLSKLKSTYVDGMVKVLDKDSRLHANFKQAGVVSGRLSCVTGDTHIVTSRGVFPIGEYYPIEGDLVPTHRGRWQKVRGKISRPPQPIVSVRLSDDRVLKCTETHRLLTPSGWVAVADLCSGMEVLDVGVAGVQERHEVGGGRGGRLHALQQADSRGVGGAVSDDYAQCAVGVEEDTPIECVHRGETPAVFALEDGSEQPDAGQVWGATSRVQGRRHDEGWVPTAEGRAALRVGASVVDCTGAWFTPPAQRVGGTPHRRCEDEQRFGQLGAGDARWASASTCGTVSVVEVTALGSAPVYDLSVAFDHSYVAQGLLHHNCAEPNLQNIPRHHEEDPRLSIRSMFVAGPGETLVVADYDQIELRVLAHFCQDPVMLDIFNNGLDIHAGTAALVLGKDIHDVTKDERQIGKGLNFAVVYGAGPDKVADMTGRTRDEADEFLDSYLDRFRAVGRWKAKILAEARMRHAKGAPDPYVTTLLGRRRRLPDLALVPYDRESAGQVRRAERQAINSVVQGSAAELLKIAMVRLDREWRKTKGCRLLFNVHDELVSSVPVDDADWAQGVVIDAMQGIKLGGTPILSVPLVVSCKAAPRWSEGK